MSSFQADDPRDQQRKLKIAIVLLFLSSATIFGTMFYLQARAKNYAASAAPTQTGLVAVAVAQKQHSAKLAQARLLRDKWRPWAMQHQQELKQMLAAQPDTPDAFKGVWGKVPAMSNAKDGGITDADLNSTQAPFSWNAVEKMVRPGREDRAATPGENAEYAAGRQFIQKQLNDDFVALKDVRISESIDSGPSMISLWASGRVTESTEIPQTIVGQPAFVQGPEQEIEPVYDFLK